MTRSEELFERARRSIPGGVDSPVRAFGAVGGTPPFVASGSGAYVTDVDGIRYIDWVQSWGANLFGHACPEIVEAATSAARRGTSFGAPTEGEVQLAERIVDALPSVEMVRLVSSGTEAAMSAIRLARGFTGREAILKFEGCYHGHSDALLAKGAGSGTITVPYNDLAAARAAFAEHGGEVAAVIVEPVAANMGVVPPEPGLLEGLRELCTEDGSLLIFDEVITGFRLAYRGAQGHFSIDPDLTVLGKVMGGGFPSAAFGGRREVMERLAPAGPVYQAGTLAGNPVTVAAGIAALDMARDRNPYPELAKTAEELATGLEGSFERAGIEATVNRIETMLSVFFTGGPVRTFDHARAADHERFARFFHHMLDRGVYLPPSGFEMWTLSTTHGPQEIERTIEAASSFQG